MIFFYLLFVFLVFYSVFLLFILIGTFRLEKEKKSQIFNKISVIIAARNEEYNVKSLMESLLNQNYPLEKFEVIAVSDRSTDKTDSVLNEYAEKFSNIRFFRTDAKKKNLIGKKNALTKGVENAKGDILLFTDADCLPNKNWIPSINHYFNHAFDVVVGYSPLISAGKGIYQKLIISLRRLERLSIFAISAGTIGWNWGVTATGRNFAYRKTVFEELNGFSGIGNIASGDDDLFLQKISRAKKYKIAFALNPESFVPSNERKNAREQYNQEKRRASKWKYYSCKIKTFSALFFIFYFLLFIGFILGILSHLPLQTILYIFIIKIAADFLIIMRGAILFNEKNLLVLFPLAEIFYIPYFLIFGILGTFSKYNWRSPKVY